MRTKSEIKLRTKETTTIDSAHPTGWGHAAPRYSDGRGGTDAVVQDSNPNVAIQPRPATNGAQRGTLSTSSNPPLVSPSTYTFAATHQRYVITGHVEHSPEAGFQSADTARCLGR